MIAESTSRLISGFVDAGVFVVFVPLLLGAPLLARRTSRVFDTTPLVGGFGGFDMS